MPTVPRGSYLIYDFAPNNPKGKFDDFFSILFHFFTFFMAKLIAGIIPYTSDSIEAFLDLLPKSAFKASTKSYLLSIIKLLSLCSLSILRSIDGAPFLIKNSF